MCRCLCWFLCFSVVTSVAFGKLPEDIQRCKISDSQCLKTSARMVLEKYSQGYAPMGLTSIDPLYFETIKVTDVKDSTSNSISINLKFNDMNVYGIKDSFLQTFKIKNHTSDEGFDVFFSINVPSAQLIGNYEINGKILLLPISGQGPSNLTVQNLSIKAQLQGIYVEQNGKYFLHLKSFKTKITTKRVYIQFDNLFNGNRVLGDSMNLMMNDAWEELFNELNPAFVQSFGALFVKAANGVFAKNPVHKLFLPENAV